MPALLDKLQKQPPQQRQQQQQHRQTQKKLHNQRLHYRYQHYQNQQKYQHQHYQHDFQQKEEKTSVSKKRKFYNLKINSGTSKSSNIIITTNTTIVSTSALISPSPLPTISKIPPIPTLPTKPIPVSTPASVRKTFKFFGLSTGRQFVAIFTLMLSIICHYSNAQQTSVASTVLLQLPKNFHQMFQGKPQLSNNNPYNISGTQNKSNNIDRNFISHINITHRTNFSVTLEDHFESIENYTKQFESLSIVDLERNKNADIQSIDSQPIFDFGMPRNITGRTGQSEAIIKCRVGMLNDKSVSWIRKRDLHILTVGTTTYTTDKRFEVSTTKDEREWTLHIKNPQARDSGIYECQVNTEPKISMAFQLNVVEIPADAKAIITGPPDLHFKVGSVIVLQCLVAQPTVKDIGPIYWYRGEQMITPFQQDDNSDYDMGVADNALFSPPSTVDGAGAGAGPSATASIDNANSFAENARTMHDLTNDITLDFTARIAMESQLGDTLKSRLRISNAQTTDTGNYTCQPTTASSASVMVHVINDEKPAAMQKSFAIAFTSQTATVSATIFLCYLTLLLVSRHTNTFKLGKTLLDHVLVLLVSCALMVMMMPMRIPSMLM